MPTVLIFENGEKIQTIVGADPTQLCKAVEERVGKSATSSWLPSDPAKGYNDVTSRVDLKGLELLNFDSDYGDAKVLFDPSKPSALGDRSKKDWVESDTDDQLMLFFPFQSASKIHSLQLTSVPAALGDGEAPMRPKTVQIYTNRSHVLGFEEAEDITPTQTVTLEANEWDTETSTANIELRFVKFQNVSSLVIFVVDGDGEGETVRLDRIRVIGESGKKWDFAKLGDKPGPG